MDNLITTDDMTLGFVYDHRQFIAKRLKEILDNGLNEDNQVEFDELTDLLKDLVNYEEDDFVSIEESVMGSLSIRTINIREER